MLNSLKVLDLSRVLAGPFCAQHLGDLGANITKIEHPDRGDETRHWGPPFQNDVSAYFASANRNKEVRDLDLEDATTRPEFERLVQDSDILIENFLPQAIKTLKLQPSELHKINPQLIICSISGFGRTASLAETPGYDLMIQAMSGMMSITGQLNGPPQKVGVAITDVLTSLYASTAILACVYARQSTGKGYHIDMSLWDCAVASQVNLAQSYLTNGNDPGPQGNAHLQIVPYQLFSAQDGHLILAVGNDRQWRRLCEANHWTWGLESRFDSNPGRVQHRDDLIGKVASELSKHPVNFWLSVCKKERVPAAPVWNYQKVFSSDLCRERHMAISILDHEETPLQLIGSPFKINGNPITSFTAPPPRSRA